MFQVYLFCLILFGGLAALSIFGDFLETDVVDLDLDVEADVDADGKLQGHSAAEKIFSIRGGPCSASASPARCSP